MKYIFFLTIFFLRYIFGDIFEWIFILLLHFVMLCSHVMLHYWAFLHVSILAHIFLFARRRCSQWLRCSRCRELPEVVAIPLLSWLVCIFVWICFSVLDLFFLCMYVRSRHDKLLTHLGSVVVSFFVLIVS